jgi:hypothetical protein
MSEAFRSLAALSSGTLATMAREWGIPADGKYADLGRFHHALLSAAVQIDLRGRFGRNWQRLAKEAFSVVRGNEGFPEQHTT